MTAITNDQLCGCCALWVANNDDSACRDYYDHTHPHARSEIAGVSDLEPTVRQDHWTCDGCDTEQLPEAKAWSYFRL